jgi:hypothetical protein
MFQPFITLLHLKGKPNPRVVAAKSMCAGDGGFSIRYGERCKNVTVAATARH